MTQDLAAYFNQTSPPNVQDGVIFEKWVRNRVSFCKSTRRHIFNDPGQIGFLLVRLSRGSEVAKEILGKGFSGIVGSDRWSGYHGSTPTTDRYVGRI